MTDMNPIPWLSSEIKEALAIKSREWGPATSVHYSGISTDSRKIQPDELFVALKGETFDAHEFAAPLLKLGVKGFVLEKKFLDAMDPAAKRAFQSADVQVFPVENTLEALGSLARYQRLRSQIKVVAITGSNGKTSTREMCARIFETEFKTLSTQGNFNNEIGLPLTLLKLSKLHEWAVVEMGMNHPGEITRLGNIGLPDIGVITNTTSAHLEGLGTVENVARAKSELMAAIASGGSAVLNVDDPRFSIMADEAKKNQGIAHLVRFGLSEAADVTAEKIEVDKGRLTFTLYYKKTDEKVPVSMATQALFMVNNALAAAAAAIQAGISLEHISQGLAGFNPVSGRMNIVQTPQGINLINDTYNANPGSMKSALQTLLHLSKGRKRYAVLGDMLELGKTSSDLHYEIGQEAARCSVSGLYAFGPHAGQVIQGAQEAGLPASRTLTGSKPEIAAALIKELTPGAWILVKGSRGMRMEEIVALLMENR